MADYAIDVAITQDEVIEFSALRWVTEKPFRINYLLMKTLF